MSGIIFVEHKNYRNAAPAPTPRCRVKGGRWLSRIIFIYCTNLIANAEPGPVRSHNEGQGRIFLKILFLGTLMNFVLQKII
jgi:hypothetical protein